MNGNRETFYWLELQSNLFIFSLKSNDKNALTGNFHENDEYKFTFKMVNQKIIFYGLV